MSVQYVVHEAMMKLTGDLSKSESVNYVYLKAERMILSISGNEFHFDELLNWIKTNQKIWYRSLFKAIKRLVYAVHELSLGNDVSENTKFIYFNTNETYGRLDAQTRKIIDGYCQSAYTGDYINACARSIARLYMFLARKGISLSNCSYEEFYAFCQFEKNNSGSENVFFRLLNDCRNFVVSIRENDDAKIHLKTFCLSKFGFSYLGKMKENAPSQTFNDGILINDFVMRTFDSFIMDVFGNSYYTDDTKGMVRYHILTLLVFHDYYGIGLSEESLAYWGNQLIDCNTGKSAYLRSAYLFLRYLHQGKKDLPGYRQCIYPSPDPLSIIPSWASSDVRDYLVLRERYGYKPSTLCMDKNSISRLVLFLNANGVMTFNRMNPEIIFRFCREDAHSTVEGKSAYLTRIRGFLRYLKKEKGYDIGENLIHLLSGGRAEKKLVTVMKEEDVERIMSSSDCFVTPYELRAYAIVLIGIRLGIRKSDIVRLRFSDIDIVRKLISFAQQKTGRTITLPMPTLVMNAIYRYVKNGRPESESEFIFLSVIPPYLSCDSGICGNALEYVSEKLGLADYRQNFHITRRTFASRTLNAGKAISTTAYLLGHSGNDTIDRYLSINQSAMRKCCLTLETIPFRGI